MMNRSKIAKPFLYCVVAVGAALCLYSTCTLPFKKLDIFLLLLALLTLFFGMRVAIRLPRINTNITVDDTFIFLTLLLYGSQPAVLLAAVSGCCSALRISKRPRNILFAGAALACSIFLTGQILNWIFRDVTSLFQRDGRTIVLGVGLMGVVQYFLHTTIVAIGNALKDNQSIWTMWSQNFLWISITYFVGAGTAGVVANSRGSVGFYALLVAVPIIAIVYFSYKRYLEEVRQSARQAELAERARAEAAEEHVNELNKHIAEQKRIGQALAESKEHFRHAAFHDALTGLPNRMMFTDLLAGEMEPANRRANQYAVLFLDLDRFKNINDSLGHAYGDCLLVSLASRLAECLRPNASLARFGGDELAILPRDAKNSADTTTIA